MIDQREQDELGRVAECGPHEAHHRFTGCDRERLAEVEREDRRREVAELRRRPSRRSPSDSVTSISRSGDAVPPAILRAGSPGAMFGISVTITSRIASVIEREQQSPHDEFQHVESPRIHRWHDDAAWGRSSARPPRRHIVIAERSRSALRGLLELQVAERRGLDPLTPRRRARQVVEEERVARRGCPRAAAAGSGRPLPSDRRRRPSAWYCVEQRVELRRCVVRRVPVTVGLRAHDRRRCRASGGGRSRRCRSAPMHHTGCRGRSSRAGCRSWHRCTSTRRRSPSSA